MSKNLRFYPLWSINGALDPSRLRAQLEFFRESGFDGVVWHPRFYPGVPPYLGATYMEVLSEVILLAKSLGLGVWLYDEDGWPSGTVGGEMLKRHPDDAQRWAGLVTIKPERCLAQFERGGTEWFLAERIGAGVDYLNPDLARHFIELTHERYRLGLAPEAWEHVEAIFCDEPEFGLGHAYDDLPPHGAIPWTPRLPELFRQRYGEDLAGVLPLLFFTESGSAEARVKFWELLRDTFCEAFLAPIDQWCREHGKLFTGHIKGEEHPLFQVPMVGSSHAVFRHLGLPGIDALERFPSNDYFPRQAASASAQSGSGRCMVEAFAGAGWGAAPEDLECYLLWLGRNGVTDFVLHLCQGRLNSAAIRDWPPSEPLHLNWSDAFPEVLRRVRAQLTLQNDESPGTLVVSPHRGIMQWYEPWELGGTNIHNAATYPDTPAGRINDQFLALVKDLNTHGIAHHFADETTLESGKVEGGVVRIGQCGYHRVILAEGVRLRESGMALVKALGSEHVFYAGEGVPDFGGLPAGGPRSELPSVAAFAPLWTSSGERPNHLVIEARSSGSGTWRAFFRCEPVPSSLRLRFADAVSSVQVNNVPFTAAPASDDGTELVLTAASLGALNELVFCAEDEAPFVWIEGRFSVCSESAFSPGPNGTVKTEGPFVIGAAEPRGPGQTEWVTSGDPFARSPLIVEGGWECSDSVSGHALRLIGIEADAVRVWLDGRELGWAWGPTWQVPLGGALDQGWHTVRLELIPSTYNFFGPHHHVDGDRHLVSPDQFRGRKNFADRPDAPDCTRVSAWHFKPLQLPRELLVIALHASAAEPIGRQTKSQKHRQR